MEDLPQGVASATGINGTLLREVMAVATGILALLTGNGKSYGNSYGKMKQKNTYFILDQIVKLSRKKGHLRVFEIPVGKVALLTGIPVGRNISRRILQEF